MSGSHLSKDFFDLVKAIGESKSKQEEDRIIIREVAQLKKQMQEKETSKKRQKEFVIRLMYVEMLGHDASFGYIKAVELTASTNLIQKRVAYLCCCQCLSPSHEFRFMIVNQLQRDMQSSNHLEVCAALMAVCKLVTVEMIPAVVPIVTELLRHDTEIVRKKAVMTLQQFSRLNPDSVSHLGDQIRRILCDPSPSVMGATLCILHDLAIASPGAYKDLVPSYVSILKQITEHRLPREFDYHRIPAPWIQIRLLKILALLGQADQQTSEGMYEVLHDVMRRADTGINVGYAIIYECVRTITTIYPNSTLLDAAASSISRFISSDNHNLKYLGVTGLAAIVKDHPKYAAAHQMAVIDCLEDPDESLKRKTLDLLYRMTNPVNVEFITDKLTQFLRETNDEFLKKELAERITQCAERFAPSNGWYIQTMTNVFELGGGLVKEEDAHNLMRLIAEGSGEDDEADLELRRDATETYLELLDKPVLPDILEQVMAWTLGEYGYLSETMSMEEIAERLCELLGRTHEDPAKTRGYILGALTKITAQVGRPLPCVDEVMNKYRESQHTDLQQRCYEYMALVANLPLMKQVLPVDASCEDIEVDKNLEFLSGFVDDAVSRGALTYNPPDENEEDEEDEYDHSKGNQGLKLDAYEKPSLPTGSIPKVTGYDSQSSYSHPGQPNPSPYNSGHFAPSSGYGAAAAPAPGGGHDPYKRPAKQVWGQHQWGATPPAGPPEPKPPTSGHYDSGRVAASPAVSPAHAPVSHEEEEYEEEGNEEPQLSEKERTAAMLFGGVPGAQAAAASRPSGRSSGRLSRSGRVQGSAKASSAAPNPGQQASAAPPRRSGSKGGRSSTQRVANGPAEPAQPAPMVDLLDMSFDEPAPVPTTAPSTLPIGVPPVTPNPVADPFSAHSPVIAPSSGGPVPGVPLDPFSSMPGMAGALPLMGIASDSGFQYNGSPLEPALMTTPEFGGLWGSLKGQASGKIQSSIRSLPEYETRVRAAHLHVVETIPATNETISSARLSGFPQMLCLVHAQIRSGGVLNITIKSTDEQLAHSLMQSLQQTLR